MTLFRLVVVRGVCPVLLATLAGCGARSDTPELGIVSGAVTLDGQPLPRVEVAFHPTDGRPAFGKTDAEGKYTLLYKPGTPGCKVGSNRVTIGNAEGDDEDSEVEGDELVQVPGSNRLAIPDRYNAKTELSRDVQPGNNVFDFELTSTP